MLSWLKRRNSVPQSPAATAKDPRSAAQLRSEGNAWLDKGDLENAETCYRQAVALDARDVLALVNLAYVLNERQSHAEARLHAQQAVALDPASVDALFVLAGAQLQESDWSAASASLQQLLQLKPDFEPAHGMLCRVFAEQGSLDEASVAIWQALALNDRSGEFHFYLGNLDAKAGAWEAASASYGRAVALEPSLSEAHLGLGRALLALGRQEEAVDSLQRAVASAPSSAGAHFSLGSAFQQMGQAEAAAKSFRAAIALSPLQAHFHHQLGMVLFALGDKTAAARCHRRAIELQPDKAGFYNGLGLALHGQKALECFQQALRLDPRHSVAHSNMGVVQDEHGDIRGAAKSFRAAIALEPERLDFRSKLLLVSTSDTSCNAAQYVAEAKAYGELATRLATPFKDWPSASARDPKMPLRVGIVSGDLRSHPVGYFLEALISHLPRHRIELIAYAADARQDDLTVRLRPHFSYWRSLVGQSDEWAAKTIRNDGVQVLMDLAGHTANNRLPVFARRPAPVQLTWLGYWASTGVSEIDYVLADPHCVPPQEEIHFTEKVWRLPETRYCFTSPSPAPDVTPLPALSTGFLTFGSFQRIDKISDTTMDLWSAVLQALPTARFRMQSAQLAQASERDRFLVRFKERGVSANRLSLHAGTPRQAYLRAYGEVDVLLDTMPFTGGATTCDALWMGVPTVTIEGRTMLSRQGASLMRTVGLAEWVAPSSASFVDTVLARVKDVQQLAALRLNLREQAKGSPLFDAPRFADNLAKALHKLAAESASVSDGSDATARP